MFAQIPTLVSAVVVGLYAWAAVVQGRETSYLAFLNDFWGNAFAADYWAWNARRIWNGFFPPGYPFLLTMLPGRRLIESAYYFNVAAGVALLGVVWAVLRRLGGAWAALLSVALVALHPLIITQALTTGPDAAFVTCSVLGALLLFSALESPRPDQRVAIVAGVALGLSGWLRYHAFPFSAALFVGSLAIGGRRAVRPVFAAAIPVAIAGLALAALGLAAGDLLSVQRDQAFNVYTRLVQAPNWFHLPPAAALPRTIGEAIARDPEAFRRNYLAFSAPHLWYLIPPLAAIALTRGAPRRFGIFVLVTGMLFVPVVNLGASPRGIVGWLPLVLIAAAWATVEGLRRVSAGPRRLAVATIVIATGAGHMWQVWRPEIRDYVQAARFRAQMSSSLEAILRADRVTVPTQVFSTTELYFLGASGWQVGNYHPRIIGGWPTIDLAGYLEVYPPPVNLIT